MEWDPSDVLSQYNTGRHQQLGKLADVKAKLIVPFELNATVGQQVDRILRIHILTTHMYTATLNGRLQGAVNTF